MKGCMVILSKPGRRFFLVDSTPCRGKFYHVRRYLHTKAYTEPGNTHEADDGGLLVWIFLGARENDRYPYLGLIPHLSRGTVRGVVHTWTNMLRGEALNALDHDFAFWFWELWFEVWYDGESQARNKSKTFGTLWPPEVADLWNYSLSLKKGWK